LNSTPNPERTDPRDVMVARLEEANTRAYEQFKQELAHVNKLLSNDAAYHPSDDPQTPITTFRPAAVNHVQVPDDRPSPGRRAVRGFTGFLLAAACIGVAAIAWQSFYGDKAKRPPLALTTSLENPELPAQPSPPPVEADAAKAAPPEPAPPAQTASEDVAPTTVAPTTAALPPELAQLLQRMDAAKAAPPQPAPPAQTAPEDVAPTTAALRPELAQLLQTMARDLATMGQGIEQLKASQEQLARDNAKIAEQLKASQEQLARVIAKASEQNPRPRKPAPRPPVPVR
jgi:hypothetical protein